MKAARRFRRVLINRRMQWLLDGLCGATALTFAYMLRFDGVIPSFDRWPLLFGVTALLFITPALFSVAGGYRATWQYFGRRDFAILAIRALPINVAMFLLRVIAPKYLATPYTVIIANYFLVLALSSAVRMLRRLDHELVHRQIGTQRILIVGTAPTLLGAVHQLQLLYARNLVGIVIDDTSLVRMKVAGIPILGQSSDLRSILGRHRVDMVFLCSADYPAIQEVIRIASDLDVPVNLLPSPLDLTSNRVRVSKTLTVNSLHSDDKLCTPDLSPAVVQCLTGRTVLVTGAGGSIGSEIVRQICQIPLTSLLMLDHNENSLFELLNEIGRTPNRIPVVADIRDRAALRNLFASHRPEVILHAAAYKHVPMMELNPCEAVLNNVCGTSEIIEAAVAFSAERVVMISSDKAVRPSSVMGATKRLAEIVVQQRANGSGSGEQLTNFACVRFGNVLGSRGSVLPIFLKQIFAGGPVTVTHEEMTRYFMTIPQAVSLVLQAATLASNGDIYMLDMGDPVRIMDFARELIELSGLTPGKDVHIEVVGSRPGEKLHEQLWDEDAHVTPTAISCVYRVRGTDVDSSFPVLLEELIDAARARQVEKVHTLLHKLPIDFLTEKKSDIAAVLTRT